jgi:predicted RNA binding protein YcfA (HicA-like mRNA interferase family)
MKSLKNIPLKELRRYLKSRGWKHIRTKGGHEIYAHKKANRSIPLQSHISPVPERIVMQFGKALDLSKKEMIEDMEEFFEKKGRKSS